MTSTPPKPKATRATVDLTDLTFDQLDEVTRLMDKSEPPVGRLTAFAFVGLRDQRPGMTLDDARKLTGRDVEIVETDPDVDDQGPSTAP